MHRIIGSDSQADGAATDALGVSVKPKCDECGVYMGAHRRDCSYLNRRDPEAMRQMREVEAYFRVRAR